MTSQGPTAGVVAPPPLVYAVPLAVGLLLHHWHPLSVLHPRLSPVMGMVLLTLGLVSVQAILAFRRAGTPPEPWKPTTVLVTDGPYRYTRNPMYLGLTLVYLGVALWVNSAWPVVFLPVVLPVMHYGVILREEAYLERLFGEEYRAYKGRVRRWL